MAEPMGGSLGGHGGAMGAVGGPLGRLWRSVEGPVRGLGRLWGVAAEGWSLEGSWVTQGLSDVRGISLG